MLLRKVSRFFRTINYPSYFVFFVTKKCNAKCKMCFYQENMQKDNGKELTVSEYDMISQQIKTLNILGISGGEPFLRNDLSEIIKVFYKNCEPLVIDLPTNGFFTDIIIKQTEDILNTVKNTVIDLQLSLDGPEAIHDEIRGLKGSFKHLKETYSKLILLKKKYKNLKIKICTVYSHYNQRHILKLFDIVKRDFNEIDRLVFSAVHGSVIDKKASNFNWGIYFQLCEIAEKYFSKNDAKDFHSLFTQAVRKRKNIFLKEVLENHDMYKKCNAGKKVVVINEVGDVFPCEPLWSKIGNLRNNSYNINNILNSEEMEHFLKLKANNGCDCYWGLPMSNNILYSPKNYLPILFDIIKRRLT